MIKSGLRTRLVLSFLLIIVLMGCLIGVFGYWVIRTKVVDRAQKQLRNDLSAARSVYGNEAVLMKRTFEMIDCVKDPAKVKVGLGLDYLFVVERGANSAVRSPLAAKAFQGNVTCGIRIIDSAELRDISEDLFEKSGIAIKPTPKARPSDRTVLTSAMAMECAAPIFDSAGSVTRVLYGGKIINRYGDLIDRIHRIVFEDKLYGAKPVGTVTIFQDDIRIATNVLDHDGEPAIGTRVSEVVYNNVVLKGMPWYSRAFVVTDWYLTAYEPIRDVTGRIVGILYVGALEAPFRDMIRSSAVVFLLILGGCTLIAVILTFLLSGSISNPLTRLVNASASLAAGDLSHRVPNNGRIRELHTLAVSFNEMADNLYKRDASLRSANDALGILNKRYLDLVGIVSHELKGILSSTVLNAYSVRDGYFGPLNAQQVKAMASITRNLDYFDLTVKNFLNLSRIEKDEISLTISEVRLREAVVDESVASFLRQAQERSITIENRIPPAMTVSVDNSLLHMVMNNLIGNAVKYGSENGTITISAQHLDTAIAIEVYNDGRPLTNDEREKLFKRFTRLDSAPEARRVRGTGLGLFLSRQIVERHNGTIRCEAWESGNAFIVTLPVVFGGRDRMRDGRS